MPLALPLIALLCLALVACQSDRDRTGSAQARPAADIMNESPARGSAAPAQAHDREFSQAERAFRQHYDSHYAGTGYAYSQYRPAYRYGFDLGADERYKNMDWEMVERLAWRGWDNSAMGDWKQYQDAVRYGWETGAGKRGG